MKPLQERCSGLIGKAGVLLLSGLVCSGGRIAIEPTASGQVTGSPGDPLCFAVLPRITQTRSGTPGDAVNLALVATETELVQAMCQAGWHPADPITLRTTLRLIASTIFSRRYASAPVSDLYLWNRKQDLAFELPLGKGVRRRHHVRFWMSPQLAPDGRPLWIGDATFDNRIEISRTTGFFTHHIAPDIDRERDKVMGDLSTAGLMQQFFWVAPFQEKLTGANGGGDPYFTDGKLAVGVLAPAHP